MRPWLVIHNRIDGASKDREYAYPALYVEVHPTGTQLPIEEQGLELHLKIGASETTLDEAGIEALRQMLEMRPLTVKAGPP